VLVEGRRGRPPIEEEHTVPAVREEQQAPA